MMSFRRPKYRIRYRSFSVPRKFFSFWRACNTSSTAPFCRSATRQGRGYRKRSTVHLKPVDIDSQRMVIRIEQGKGRKDRYVMLSVRLLEILRQWWRTARPQHWLFPGKRADMPITRHAVENACQEAFSRCGI